MRYFSIFVSLFLAAQASAAPLPRPDHIVIVVEENKSFSQIIDNPDAPYINALSRRGVLFTQSYGTAHPSQPNYLALFSGSTQDITNNACPHELSGANLASAMIGKGMSFVSYAESMPHPGFEGCIAGSYFRKHNPISNWKDLAAYNQPFSAFPQDYAQLPTVALVIPDQRNDMHDGSVAQGDAWLSRNIEPYAQWAMTHNSLLIITWDEDNSQDNNRIATIFVGPMLNPGISAQRIDHYSLLRTIEDVLALPHLGESAMAKPIEFEPVMPALALNMQAGGSFKDCATCPDMVAIPGKNFALGKYEVTQAEWESVMQDNPSNFKGANLPVEMVSWNDIQEYLMRLNKMTGKNYRLPKEAEWQYACRGGKRTKYCGSNDYNAVAWYKGNSDGQTHQVGKKEANRYGLHDMNGNVWEWVEECYSSNCAIGRTLRGGSWTSTPQNAHAATRLKDVATTRSSNYGFRLAVTLP